MDHAKRVHVVIGYDLVSKAARESDLVFNIKLKTDNKTELENFFPHV